MKIEQQVCSLKSAKKLKELGVKQGSLFWFNLNNKIVIVFKGQDTRKFYSAFTVAELGEMLPKGCFSLKTESEEFPYRCEYKQINGYTSASGADTEAEARAKMLIYLLENKLI